MSKSKGLTQEQNRAFEVLQERSGPRLVGLRGLSRRAVKGLVQAGLAQYVGTKEQSVKLAGDAAHVSVRKPKKGSEVTLYKVVYFGDVMDQPKVRKHEARRTAKTIRIPGEGTWLPSALERQGFFYTPEAAKAAYQAKLKRQIEGFRQDIERAQGILKLGIGNHNF